MMEMTLYVNGVAQTLRGDPQRALLGVLRDDLDLTGTKYGCGEAQCGACLVLLDGEPVPACVTPVGSAAGKQVLTIEGLAGPQGLHPVQAAFVAEEALQCGYCTPGMIMGAVALLRRSARPSEAEIVQAMDVHLCRCGVYPRIVRAIQRAAGLAAGPGGPAAAGEPGGGRGPAGGAAPGGEGR